MIRRRLADTSIGRRARAWRRRRRQQLPGPTLPPFVIDGVPRSGTTYTVHLLNSHPSVVCGWERFAAHRLTPAHLTHRGFEQLDLRRAEVQHGLEQFAAKRATAPLYVGDKLPLFYGTADRVAREFDFDGHRLRLAVLIRSLDEVASSWWSRADRETTGWYRGQYGVFPYLEFLTLVTAYTNQIEHADVAFVSYAKLIEPDRGTETVDALFGFVADGPDPAVSRFLADQPRKLERLAACRREPPPDLFSSSDPFFDDVVDRVDAAGFVRREHIADFLADALSRRRHESVFEDELRRYIAGGVPAECIEYGRRRMSRYDDLLRPTEPTLGKLLTDAFG